MSKKLNQLIDMQFPEAEIQEYEQKAQILNSWLIWTVAAPFVLFSKIIKERKK